MADTEITHILSDRERNVLTLRFGIDGGRSLTLGEVGEGLGCMRERVRQIEAKAIRKIKQLKPDPAWPYPNDHMGQEWQMLQAWEADVPACCDACFKVIMDIADIPGVATPSGYYDY